nr:PREDICTED: leucine-rich repeat-containing protein 52 [Latimeria chalumnae]|eukprot:XP_014343140.1 PREDICTED: leucine-rich repeat-containing protein 52 [Latimeria chalumnae]
MGKPNHGIQRVKVKLNEVIIMFRCGTQPLGLLLLLLFGLEVTALAECPWGCTCNSLIVNCSGRQLQQFPSDIPLITRRLILADNNLLELPPLQLNFLSDLVYLDCRNNSITEVSEAAFINILKLVYIDLSYNELTIITDWTFELLVNLVVLKIANNPGLSEIEKDAFSNNTGLRELDLSGNNLTHLDLSEQLDSVSGATTSELKTSAFRIMMPLIVVAS